MAPNGRLHKALVEKGLASQVFGYPLQGRDPGLMMFGALVKLGQPLEPTRDEMLRVIESLGLRAHVMPGVSRTAIGITGNKGVISLQHFENLPGVAEAIRVTKPYKLITLDLKQERTIVDVGGAKIGNSSLAMIAGPCAIENRKQAFAIAEVVEGAGGQDHQGLPGALRQAGPLRRRGGRRPIGRFRTAGIPHGEGVNRRPAGRVRPKRSAARFSGSKKGELREIDRC